MRHDLFRFSGGHIPMVAVVAIRWPNNGGTHTGIIHLDEGKLYFLDLQRHRVLVNREWKGKYCHVIPNIDEDAMNDVAGYCRLIVKRNEERPGEVPYALKFDSHARFSNSTGQLHLSGEGIGLTCATFVLIVFESAEAPLVEFDDWPRRDDDDQRHEDLIDFLRGDGVEEAHICQVQAQLPCTRVRPEEVAGAGMSPELPAKFPFAEKAGRWILGLLDHNGGHGLSPC